MVAVYVTSLPVVGDRDLSVKFDDGTARLSMWGGPLLSAIRWVESVEMVRRAVCNVGGGQVLWFVRAQLNSGNRIFQNMHFCHFRILNIRK